MYTQVPCNDYKKLFKRQVFGTSREAKLGICRYLQVGRVETPQDEEFSKAEK